MLLSTGFSQLLHISELFYVTFKDFNTLELCKIFIFSSQFPWRYAPKSVLLTMWNYFHKILRKFYIFPPSLIGEMPKSVIWTLWKRE